MGRENDSYRTGLEEQIRNIGEEQTRLESEFDQDRGRLSEKHKELRKGMDNDFTEENSTIDFETLISRELKRLNITKNEAIQRLS